MVAVAAKAKILIVEENQTDIDILLAILAQEVQAETAVATTIDDFYSKVLCNEWDLVISDYTIGAATAVDAIEFVNKHQLHIPVVVISGKMPEDQLATVMRAGATDCLIKGNYSRLPAVIERDIPKGEQNRKHLALLKAISRGKFEWEAAIDTSPDMIILTDVLGNVTRCNRKASETLGLDYLEIIGKKVESLFYTPAMMKGNLFSTLEAVAETKDVTFPKLPGWYKVKCRPVVHREDDTINGRAFTIEETTHHKEILEDKLLSERELLCMQVVSFKLNSKENFFSVIHDILSHIHSLLEIDFSAIHVLQDKDMVIHGSLNVTSDFFKSACRIPRSSRWVTALMTGENIRSDRLRLPMPEDIKRAATNMGVKTWCAIPLVSDQDVTGSLWVAKKSGKAYTARELKSLRAICNQLAVLVENHSLFTELKKKAALLENKERELEINLQRVSEANRELASLNKAKDMFIGMASHELKSPLASMSTALQHMIKYDNANLAKGQMSMLQASYDNVQSLAHIVDDLLSLSRLEMNDHKPEKVPFNLLSVFRRVQDSCKDALEKRRISLTIAGEEDAVPVDPTMFGYVARNLVENAIKFTPDEGTISVTGSYIKHADCLALIDEIRPFYPNLLKTTLPPEFYRIDIKDTGIGIPTEERVKVFDKFYGIGDMKSHYTSKSAFMGKGTGLGLAIVKLIVDAHDGIVWISTKEGEPGTTISVVIPSN